MTTDQNYQQIYRVGGILDAGFVGQITYTISLDQVMTSWTFILALTSGSTVKATLRLSSLTDFRRSALQNMTPRPIPSRSSGRPFCTK